MFLSAAAAMAMMMTPAAPLPQYQTRAAPRGSYAQSCSGAYTNQGRLYADCRDERGQIRGTSIELNRCSDADIANVNGLLVCGRVRGDYEGGGRPGGPGGGWGGPGQGGPGWGGGRNSITVYEDSNFRGRSMSFNEAIPDLRNSGLNDRISSMQLRGGAWEVCTDARFRGDCRVVSGDIRNLDRAFNDKISSLRPARGGGRW